MWSGWWRVAESRSSVMDPANTHLVSPSLWAPARTRDQPPSRAIFAQTARTAPGLLRIQRILCQVGPGQHSCHLHPDLPHVCSLGFGRHVWAYVDPPGDTRCASLSKSHLSLRVWSRLGVGSSGGLAAPGGRQLWGDYRFFKHGGLTRQIGRKDTSAGKGDAAECRGSGPQLHRSPHTSPSK